MLENEPFNVQTQWFCQLSLVLAEVIICRENFLMTQLLHMVFRNFYLGNFVTSQTIEALESRKLRRENVALDKTVYI